MTAPKKLGIQRRYLDLAKDAIDPMTRTARVAFSTETPVERMWGNEILDHSPSAVRLGRLRNGGAVLVDHDPTDQVGVVDDVEISEDRMGRAVLRFGKSARAQEIFQDVQDGIRRHVSVGYAVHGMALESRSEGEPDCYRVTDWEPMEISVVAIPADPNASVGRSDTREFDVQITTSISEEPKMTDPTPAPAPSVDVQAVRNEARDAEISRAREILAIGALHHCSERAQKAVAEGVSLDQFRADVLADLAKSRPVPTPDIGLTQKEARSFSFLRAINAMADPTNRRMQEEAAFERECSEAAAQKYGRTPRGFMIPHDVMAAPMSRALITGTATGTAKGGNLIQTDVLAANFIDVLRNNMVLPRLGATYLSGLSGNIAIPKKSTASTSYWVAENNAPTAGAMVFSQVTMSPKTLAAYVDFSRRLAIQSSLDVESLVRDDLARGIAVTLDGAALGGANTNGPTGVRGTSSIGSVAMGTNGGAPTWASITGLVGKVEQSNVAISSGAFVTNMKVKAKLASTLKTATDTSSNFLLAPPYSELFGYPIEFTNSVPSNLTKGSASGVCSAMLFGNWSDLVIGQWSGVDLLADPYTGSSAGTVRVTAFVDTDVAVRYPEAFAAVVDYTTT